jgi:hypothetical protein
MRPIGFSTGALALSDYRQALGQLRGKAIDSIELSALRFHELRPLLESLPTLDLGAYRYRGIHAPSRFEEIQEIEITELLRTYIDPGWPIVLHPDTIHDPSVWLQFGSRLAIENMDRRKPVGRTAEELSSIFELLPDATLCFDIGHARQCDTSMTEAYRILHRFAHRLRWVHLSEVNTLSHHESLSYAAIWAFSEVAHLIPESVPIILEARITAAQMDAEIEKAKRALPLRALSTLIA